MDSNVQKRRENKKSLRVKVISLGNAEVGKSCIIKRYCEKRFVPKYLATIGIDYGVTKVQVRDREIKVNIFDMAGHPFFYEAFFSSITDMCENGGKRPVAEVTVGFTKEQADTIRRIRNSKDFWDMLGVKPGATREEVNKAYRKLAVLLHPDKCVAPGSEDAFKDVVNARTSLLKNIR
uniref:dnaJ homolog subfamily C member 27-like n=1 Tax=Oncorhynchus gorbuscha TaxID=8017 RepID=UPI001EAF6E44|nr:dnaJ homolog subfamily C member 27-like [Oncorhynchus gorbuscha]